QSSEFVVALRLAPAAPEAERRCASSTPFKSKRPQTGSRQTPHYGSAVRIPAGPPLVLITPAFCSDLPPSPEKRITVISSSTMHCTRSILLLLDQAMPCTQWPTGKSAILESWLPLRAQICNSPLAL